MNKIFRNTAEKTITKSIQDEVIRFRYPNFSDKISIEATITLLTRGQFNSLAMSMFVQQKQASDFAEMIAVLEQCTTVLNEKNEEDSVFYWRNLDPFEDKHIKFIKEVYDEFVSWRESFRSKPDKVDTPTSQDTSKK